jgi:group I intron endonuclease
MILKVVSAVSSRREVSILFNRVAIMILLHSSAGGAGIGIYNCLFHSTVITHSFDLFIYIIGVIMLLFTPDSTVNLTDSVLLCVVPLVIYTNSDLEKERIIKENKGKSGIYRWVNKESMKSYVGSSVNLSKRFQKYYCYNHIADPACNRPIHRGLLKYGYSNFTLEILEYCEPSKCIEREQHFIDAVQPEYNILKTAGSSLGYQHIKEAKQKMSEAKLGISRPKLSEDTRRRMSAAKLGTSLSEETRFRMSAARKGKTKIEGSGRPKCPIEVLDLETGIKIIYPSIGEAARALGIRQSTITLYFSCHSKKPFKGRYIFTKIGK